MVVVVLALLVALGAMGGARADDTPSRAALEQASLGAGDPAAEALFFLGQLDEADFDFASALARYQASVVKSPSSRYAPRASNRASQLKAHAEGDFAPLAELERIRRDPAQANDPAAIEKLARDAEAFPAGLVRVESWMLIAEAYLGRLNRHADALTLLRRVMIDPKSDPLTARQAARQIVETLADDGQLDLAATTARELRNRLDPAFVVSVQRRARRRVLHRVAIGDLVVVGGLVATAIALAMRRARSDAATKALLASAPIAFAFAAFVALAGGILASTYEAGNAKPFFLFGAIVAPLFVVARAWGAAGSPRPAARLARALACGSATVAAAFLVLEGIDPAYLEGFGL